MYKIVIDSEDTDSLHFRVLGSGDTEVYAGGVDRVEYDEFRRDTGYSKEATLWEFAKKRGGLDGEVMAQPALPFDGTLPVTPHAHPDYLTPGDLDGLRRELLDVVSRMDDGSLRKLREDFGTHTHPQYLSTVPSHGHAAMETRVGALELGLEKMGEHGHPLPNHQHQHGHPEFESLNSANIALATELAEQRKLLLSHGHPHGHEDTELHLEALEGAVGDLELDTPALPEFAKADHTHPAPVLPDVDVVFEPLLARLVMLEDTVRSLKAKKGKGELRVLSREDRGGKHIIIAEEV